MLKGSFIDHFCVSSDMMNSIKSAAILDSGLNLQIMSMCQPQGLLPLGIFLGQSSMRVAYSGIRQICRPTIMIRITDLVKFVCQFIFCIAYLVVVMYSKPLLIYLLRYLTSSSSQQV